MSYTDDPLVSVCIPVYNCELFIKETVEAVLAQTYKTIEVIIVNDGSTDNTRSILKEFENHPVNIFHQENAGASAARNLAFEKSKGQYIKFLDGDDLINPEMIASQVKLALKAEGSIISAKWGRFYNNNISTFKLNTEDCWQTLSAQDWLYSSWKNGHSMTQPGIFLIPRNIIESAGPWDEQLTLVDDLDFFTRVILKSQAVVFDAESTLFYRSGHSGNLSGRKEREALLSAFKSIDKATTNLLAVNTQPKALLACANTWQHFVYIAFPNSHDLVAQAEAKIDKLGGSSLKFMAGGFTKFIASIIGWKTTRRLKVYFKLP